MELYYRSLFEIHKKSILVQCRIQYFCFPKRMTFYYSSIKMYTCLKNKQKKPSAMLNVTARCQCGPTLARLNGTGSSGAPRSLLSSPRGDRRCGGSSASLTDEPRRVSTKAPHLFSLRKCPDCELTEVSSGRRRRGRRAREPPVTHTERFEGSLVSAEAARHSQDGSLSASTVQSPLEFKAPRVEERNLFIVSRTKSFR